MHSATMKTKNIFSAILMAMLVLVLPFALTSCDGDDQLDTNQYVGGVSLNAFGPSPVARGGELRFLGSGLDKVTSITIPGCDDITDITRKSSNEISIIVPKIAQPGYVVLHSAKGDITTKTKLSFTEPVGFAESGAIAPNPVKPGQTLTIKGSYLNLVTSIIFAEDVVAIELEHSSAAEPMDQWIKVIVPAKAQTGKIFLGFVATGDTLVNKVLSDDELEVILPAVAQIANLTGKKPGDKIEIAGSDLDLVAKVTVADEEVEYSVKDGKLSFVLPTNTPDAAEIAMYPASEIKITIAVIGMTIPTELVATPAKELRNGDAITITGKDLDVVESILFPGVADAVDFSTADNAITVNCPEGFTSGNVSLVCKSGIVVPVAIETQKPVFESFAAAQVSMGNDVTINGQNLDLVSKVLYAGKGEGAVLEGGTATQIVVTMPSSGPESGALTLVMANGETVSTEALTIDAPEFCNIIGWPELGEDEMIQAGSVMTVTVANGDRLVGVEINGEPMQFIVNGDKLIMNTPYAAKPGSVIKLISDNGSIEYTYDFKPNTEIVTVLWKGASELGWSGDGQVYIGTDGGPELIAAQAKAGDLLRIQLQPTADDWCVQVWEGHWSTQYAEIKADNYDLAGNNNYYIIELTDELIATFTTAAGWGGILLTQGQSCVVTRLELVQVVSLETTIWQGSETMDWGNNQPYLGSDAGQEFIDAGVKAGMKCHFYLTASDPLSWRFQIFEGHWGPQYADFSGDGNEGSTVWDLDANKGRVTITLTQDMVDAALTQQWWGGIFVVQGQFCTVTKVTVE